MGTWETFGSQTQTQATLGTQNLLSGHHLDLPGHWGKRGAAALVQTKRGELVKVLAESTPYFKNSGAESVRMCFL